MSVPHGHDEPGARPMQGGEERFVWPPRRAPDETAKRPPERARAPARAKKRPIARPSAPGLVESIERTWFDLRCPPLARRLELLGWRPDDPADYCWRCGGSVGRHDVDADGCSACRHTRPPWSRFVRLGEYVEPLSTLIPEVKFTRFRRLGTDLGALLGDAVAEQIALQGAELGQAAREPWIVPVPTTARRRLARGIDHTSVIGRAVALRTGGRLVELLRRDHRPSQLAVAPSRRAGNVSGSVRMRRGGLGRRGVGSRLIVVVDDVMTSGATMRACCRAIRDGAKRAGRGVTLWAAVAARAPRNEWVR